MDVEKDNIARVLKQVVKIADPNVVLGVVESIDLTAMKTTSDATTVFYLLRQVIESVRPDSVVKQCLTKTWEDLLASGRAHLMIQSNRSKANREPEEMMADNMFAWLCVHADMEFSPDSSSEDPDVNPDRHDASMDPGFACEYIYRCVDLLYKGEHQAVALHMLRSLLEDNQQYILKQKVGHPEFFVRSLFSM